MSWWICSSIESQRRPKKRRKRKLLSPLITELLTTVLQLFPVTNGLRKFPRVSGLLQRCLPLLQFLLFLVLSGLLLPLQLPLVAMVGMKLLLLCQPGGNEPALFQQLTVTGPIHDDDFTMLQFSKHLSYVVFV
uniref:Uncharacterized protein n=1 Tax=Opuntia streptacantha TaxID=393608 RepID=A0A7C8ZHI9_OPUST